MNEIFIILNNQYSFVDLNFENFINEFYFFNKKYNFTFINKDCIKIYTSSESFFIYTQDSFIFYNNEILITHFKMIELIHNEWFDQAILINSENKLIRIRDRDQYGEFKILDNKDLNIHWNYWGEEIFTNTENNIYIHDSCNHYLSSKLINVNNNYNNININVFIHACLMNNGLNILYEQLEKLKKSELYDYINSIIICVLGNPEEIIYDDNKIKIIHLSNEFDYYELLTINYIKDFCKDKVDEHYILYIHTKGVNKNGNEECIKSWRHMMEYFLIDQYKICLDGLIDRNLSTIGNNLINSKCIIDHRDLIHVNKDHCYHYSGNFWWSKSSYIKNLDYISIQSNKENRKIQRYQAENWLLSKKNKDKHGILYQNNTNIHPYHFYLFKNYLNKLCYLKIV